MHLEKMQRCEVHTNIKCLIQLKKLALSKESNSKSFPDILGQNKVSDAVLKKTFRKRKISA